MGKFKEGKIITWCIEKSTQNICYHNNIYLEQENYQLLPLEVNYLYYNYCMERDVFPLYFTSLIWIDFGKIITGYQFFQNLEWDSIEKKDFIPSIIWKDRILDIKEIKAILMTYEDTLVNDYQALIRQRLGLSMQAETPDKMHQNDEQKLSHEIDVLI